MAIDVSAALEAATTTDADSDLFDFRAPVEETEPEPDDASDAPSSEEEAEVEAEEVEEEDSEEESDPEEADEPAPEVKVERKKPFYVETKDGKTKLPPDATIAVKVDGKSAQIPLADAVDAWNSKAENEKTFAELRRKEVEVSTQVAQIREELESKIEQQDYQITAFNEVLKNLYDSATKGSPLAAFAEVLEAANMDALQIVRGIRDQIIESAENYLQLSPAERKSVDLADELDYIKRREAKRAERESSTKAREAQKRERLETLSSYGIPDERTFKQLQTQLSQANGGKAVEPKQVGEYYKTYQQAMFVGSVLNKVDKALVQDTDFVGKLVKLVNAYDPSEQELEQTIRQLLSAEKGSAEKPRSAKAPVRKPQRSGETKTQNKPFRKEDLFL